MGPRILGYCPKCGKTIYHDSGFVRDELNVWCPEHAPATPRETPFEETVPKTIPDAAFTVLDEEPMGKSMAQISKEITDRIINDAMVLSTPAKPCCSRCKLRLPMDGADFCEWCAKDGDFDLIAVSRHGGAHAVTATNDKDCPACAKKVHAFDVRYRAGPFTYHTACAYRISKEARGHDYAGRTLVTSKGIRSDLEANQPPIDVGGTITKEVLDKAFAPRPFTRPERIVGPLQFRLEAAERLARLVKDHLTMQASDSPGAWIGSVTRDTMIDEAKRVLGEHP